MTIKTRLDLLEIPPAERPLDGLARGLSLVQSLPISYDGFMRTVIQKGKKNTVTRLSRREIWFYKGQTSFRHGNPIPQWPDDEWWGKLNDGQCFWLGYMLARARSILKEEQIRAYIEDGDDLPPDIH